MIPRIIPVIAGLLAAGCLTATVTMADVWQAGRVREVLLHGMTNDVAVLDAWKAAGVNSCLGVAPAVAHERGLKARRWFSMNYMDDRVLPAETIKQMAVRGRDGSYLRPSDAVFPAIGEHGWSACVNNPQWRAQSVAAFTKMAQDGYDGCHVEYASRIEACFCEHCKARWPAWAQRTELTAAATLEAAADAKDFRTRTLLREFRILCVMEFLQQLRDAARKVKPDFVVDGELHQDSGSIFQCVYGNHLDGVCIEGATFGEFPPAGQQLLWLKLLRAVSRGKVPMALTYNVLRDTAGKPRYAAMPADRLGVAMAEILALGGVSWLGWGGPDAPNLLAGHEARARAFHALAAQLEPALADAKPMAWLAVIFSPRSYFASGQSRGQYYALGQGLMKAQIPFAVLSDADLTPEKLRGFTGVVLLDACALSEAGVAALDGYVKAGGKLMVFGEDAGKYGADWKERTQPIAWLPAGDKPRPHGQGMVYPASDEFLSGKTLGASQNVSLRQLRPDPLALEASSRAQGVIGQRGPDYAVTADLHYTDDTSLTGLALEFTPGTHDWEFQRLLIKPEKPVRRATVRLVLRGRAGTAWFREVRLGEWNPKVQRISRNLLGTQLKPAGGKSYTARPLGDADKGAWNVFRDGFAVETLPNLGHVIRLTGTGGLPVGRMHLPQPDIAQRVRQMIAPLLPSQPLVRTEGAGADMVFCDTSYAGDRLLLQFINYNAELHPEQPEGDQLKNEKTIPATGLRVTLALNLRPTAATWAAPGVAAQPLQIAPPLTFVLPRLDQWGVVTLQLK